MMILDPYRHGAAVGGGAPVANDDSAQTDEDTAVNIHVLINDTEVGGAGIDVTSVATTSQPANGGAVANADGTITYTPDSGFFSPPDETFTYTVDSNDAQTSNTATVTVEVVEDPGTTFLLAPDVSGYPPGTPGATGFTDPAELTYFPGTKVTNSDLQTLINTQAGVGVTDDRNYLFFAQDPKNAAVGNTVWAMRMPGQLAQMGGIKIQADGAWPNQTRHDELWIAYDVLFETGFDFSWGFKMPGFGALHLTSDNNPFGSGPDGNYATSRYMVHGSSTSGLVPYPSATPNIPDDEGVIGAYSYWTGKRFQNLKTGLTDWTTSSGSANTVPSTGYKLITRNTWFRVKQRAKMNTVINSKLVSQGAVAGVDYLLDGEQELYIDDVLRGHRSNVPWRTVSNLQWNASRFAHYHGGSDTRWRNAKEQGPFIKNFVIHNTDPDA